MGEEEKPEGEGEEAQGDEAYLAELKASCAKKAPPSPATHPPFRQF